MDSEMKSRCSIYRKSGWKEVIITLLRLERGKVSKIIKYITITAVVEVGPLKGPYSWCVPGVGLELYYIPTSLIRVGTGPLRSIVGKTWWAEIRGPLIQWVPLF